MRRIKSPKIFLYFSIGKVIYHIETNDIKQIEFFFLGGLPMRIRPLEKSLYFSMGKVTHHNKNNVEKKKPSSFFTWTGCP
jgi:hypothetical protein